MTRKDTRDEVIGRRTVGVEMVGSSIALHTTQCGRLANTTMSSTDTLITLITETQSCVCAHCVCMCVYMCLLIRTLQTIPFDESKKHSLFFLSDAQLRLRKGWM